MSRVVELVVAVDVAVPLFVLLTLFPAGVVVVLSTSVFLVSLVNSPVGNSGSGVKPPTEPMARSRRSSVKTPLKEALTMRAGVTVVAIHTALAPVMVALRFPVPRVSFKKSQL